MEVQVLSVAPSHFKILAPVAQLDRASDYGSEGCGFDSCRARQFNKREVAQLGRALGLGPRGRRFESCLPDHFLIEILNHGALAQLGERLPCTQEVSGSIPLGSTIYFGGIPKSG